MITILFFIIFFYILFFLVDSKAYNIIFGFIVSFGTLLWIVVYLLEFYKVEFGLWNLDTIRNSAAILCFSILSPGFTLYIIKFIKNNSNPNRKWKIIKNYHVHEGLIGILFVVIAFLLWAIRFLMVQHEVFKKKLRIFLAIDMVLLFLFLFSGSFLILRDRRDIVRLKLIEKRKKQSGIIISSTFNQISQDSIRFFKSPKGLFYPFGILLNCLAVNLFIHGTDFLPKEIFHLDHETIVLIGFILCFLAGGLVGFDWLRLFSKLYPELYQELELILDDLEK
ncbi:MAG: hypothetical protein ACFFFT_02305 [Candidatus Thorarchaeota archaeon]